MQRDARHGLRQALLGPAVPLVCIAAGAGLWLFTTDRSWALWIWRAGLVASGTPVLWRTARGMLAGRFAADIVAALAILGAVVVDQPLAGLVVVLMLLGGEALERYAEGRASRALHTLEQAAPRVAHLVTGTHDGPITGDVRDVSAGDVNVGDLLLIRPGELIPCDGVVTEGESAVDTSAINGEPVPLHARAGSPVASGWLNGDGAVVVRASARASESQYARIVELVRNAQSSKAHLQRLADRYAVWFTPATLVVCGAAYWWSGDPVRALAVLVVATPCPLILATPIAIIGGVDRAARRQIIVRNGEALEQLARVDVAVFDKTGTLTIGQPAVARVVVSDHIGADDALRLAAAVEQRSSHLLARTTVDAARDAGIGIPTVTEVVERPGRGVEGRADGHQVLVGAASLAAERYPAERAAIDALQHRTVGLRAQVMIDGRAAAVIEYADRLRHGTADVLARLTRLGVRRTVLLSGDRGDEARAVAAVAGIAEAIGDLLPEGKVEFVAALVRGGHTVMMVGDGTNDAPALARASVGVALAGHGGGVTAEAADVVVLNDDLGRVVDAITIGRRTMRVARQGIWIGLALSGIAMAWAAAGAIPPVQGALLQELIDVGVILNALRAARTPRAASGTDPSPA